MSEPTTETRTVEDLLAENARLRRKVASLKELQAKDDAEYAEAIAERDRALETLAFQERHTLPELRRAVERHKDGKQRWRERAEKAEAEAHQYRTALQGAARKAEGDRAEREAVKQRLDAVLDLCDREQRNAMRWENPIPVPDWVGVVQQLALGDDKRTEAAR